MARAPERLRRYADELIGVARALGGADHVLANVASVAVIAIAGLALNLLVARVYGMAGLALLGQALALFLILGQVVAGGFAFSTLYYFSHHGADGPDGRTFLATMCLPVIAVGALITVVLLPIAEPFGRAFGPTFGAVLPVVAGAAALFALNKVVGAALNGMGRLNAFALIQAARLPLMLGAAAAMAAAGVGIGHIGWMFVASEAALLVLATGLFVGATQSKTLRLDRIGPMLSARASHGWRGSLIGLLADINTKLDILIVSLFVSDIQVGIFAFGALFAEGLAMVLAAIQNVVNPRVAHIAAARDQGALDQLRSLLAYRLRPAILVLALGGLGFILLVAPWIVHAADTRASAIVFAIMAAAFVLATPAIVLNQAPTQAGAPMAQTAFYALLALANLALALTLVPHIGIYGAAAGTAGATIVQVPLLHWLVRRTTGLRLLGATAKV